ncbi:MAG: polysaccharide deacetylase family protein (PEP-CTERM system associated) [Myxococcota bacterium]|jgi:polysaccharide deacetylase family protein (PEP-CTERM system associated)
MQSTANKPKALNFFSIDLEDWFHILDSDAAPSMETWTTQEARVEANTQKLLDELEHADVRATFFVLGWIADHYPALVRRIADAGHEVASHGYAHSLIYEQTPQEFRDDLRRASDAIEAAAGTRPRGFRAPGFSIREDSDWALDVLAAEGFDYDSSVFPTSRAHGGLPGADAQPTVLPNGLREFPISTIDTPLGRLAYLGGGYLRVFPTPLILHWARSQKARNESLVLYLHPRDIDIGQPRLSLGAVRNFKSYVGLAGCLDKVKTLLSEFDWVPFRDDAASN